MEEDAPAQVVEEDVSEVMRRGQPVGGELEPVGRGHNPVQVVPPGGHVVADLAEQPGRPAELGAQLDDLPLGPVHVRHQGPGACGARFEAEAGLHEVGPAPPAHLGFRPFRPAGVEGGEPPRREVEGRRPEPVAPHGGGLQRLARLGPIDRLGLQGVEGERGPGHALAPLVGVEEAAEARLQVLVHVGGQEVQQSVEEVHLDRSPAGILDRAFADEAEGIARGPLVAEGDPQVPVGLLEDEPAPEDVLVEAAGDPVGEQVRFPEGVPERAPAAPRHHQRGDRPGLPGGVDQLVLGDVGEERDPRVLPARGEAAVAGDEEPVVGVAHHAHEERAHPLGVVDDVELVAQDLGEAPLDGPSCRGNGAPPEVDDCWSSHVAPGRACPSHRFGRNFVRQQNKLSGAPAECQDGRARCTGAGARGGARVVPEQESTDGPAGLGRGSPRVPGPDPPGAGRGVPADAPGRDPRDLLQRLRGRAEPRPADAARGRPGPGKAGDRPPRRPGGCGPSPAPTATSTPPGSRTRWG